MSKKKRDILDGMGKLSQDQDELNFIAPYRVINSHRKPKPMYLVNLPLMASNINMKNAFETYRPQWDGFPLMGMAHVLMKKELNIRKLRLTYKREGTNEPFKKVPRSKIEIEHYDINGNAVKMPYPTNWVYNEDHELVFEIEYNWLLTAMTTVFIKKMEPKSSIEVQLLY